MHKIIPNVFTFISDFKKEEILNLDKNIGIIFRNYKNQDENKIIQLKKYCKSLNKKFYLANNLKLALKLNLDGFYIPAFNREISVVNFGLKKNFLVLGSAHNVNDIRIKERQGVEVIFLSPLFKTKNYKNPLGPLRFNNLARLSKKKIIALGGINKKNIKRLKITNAYGFSGISYFKQ